MQTELSTLLSSSASTVNSTDVPTSLAKVHNLTAVSHLLASVSALIASNIPTQVSTVAEVNEKNKHTNKKQKHVRSERKEEKHERKREEKRARKEARRSSKRNSTTLLEPDDTVHSKVDNVEKPVVHSPTHKFVDWIIETNEPITVVLETYTNSVLPTIHELLKPVVETSNAIEGLSENELEMVLEYLRFGKYFFTQWENKIVKVVEIVNESDFIKNAQLNSVVDMDLPMSTIKVKEEPNTQSSHLVDVGPPPVDGCKEELIEIEEPDTTQSFEETIDEAVEDVVDHETEELMEEEIESVLDEPNNRTCTVLQVEEETYDAVQETDATIEATEEETAEVIEEEIVEETAQEEVVEETVEEEVVEETTEDEVVEETTEDEVVEETTEDEVVEETTEDEVVEETVEDKVVEETVEDEMVEEEYEEVEIEDKTYFVCYTTKGDEENGKLYECINGEEVGECVGEIKDGEVILYE